MLDLLLEYWLVPLVFVGVSLLIVRWLIPAEAKFGNFTVRSTVGGVAFVLAVGVSIYRFPDYIAADQSKAVDNLNSEKSRLDETVNSRDATIEDLRSSINEKDAELVRAKRQLDEANGLNTTLQTQVDTLSIRIDSQDEEIRKQGTEIRELRLDEAREKSRADKAEDDLTREETKSRQLAAELEQALIERDQSEQQAHDAWSTVHRLQLSEDDKRFLEGLERTIEDINTQTEFIKIRRVPFPVIGDQSTLPVFEFYDRQLADGSRELPRGYGLFRFQSERFRIEGDYQDGLIFELENELGTALCNGVASALGQTQSVANALSQIPELAKYDANPDFVIKLGEIKYIKQRLFSEAFQAEFFVRGYADGSRDDWETSLPENMGTIQVLPVDRTRGDQRLAQYFDDDPIEKALTQTSNNTHSYTNDLLPNLRGKVTADLIDGLVRACPGQVAQSSITSPRVLDGRVYSTFGSEDRKSRVFLRVTAKR